MNTVVLQSFSSDPNNSNEGEKDEERENPRHDKNVEFHSVEETELEKESGKEMFIGKSTNASKIQA